ncbi:signal recognition particle-docking protein FtsY [Corynebacterium glucuronolyticum]|uniref:Signal recognition particle receptor FtsY n=1 Tax=Corynebacterium glucuronolyticum TaxID=39791 RepID=A0A7T4JU43_9CORY|nr:signal recognition particle-docking protein FtsY [Corynebacterium glucuronolyticum]QQB45480.1 signal recognition particle-docking protein FtsY [Corynebacterium glucuronolyticum]WKD63884.1 Signal recognition particle receptor FtsY [Corynebacterium glucuronolyticum DSM 44120]SMB86043.1 signal recognition particle-docking protein FtsY [Corynebacterium glucuronolyticum]
MIDSTTLPYWIIGIVIAIIIIALVIYFGLKRGKSKQVSFEKKEEPKELTQAEKSGNYQAKSGFNFAAGNSGDKQPVVNGGQTLTTTPAKSATTGATAGAAAGASAAGVSAAAAATAQARELKREQEQAAAKPAAPTASTTPTASTQSVASEGAEEPVASGDTRESVYEAAGDAAQESTQESAPTPKEQVARVEDEAQGEVVETPAANGGATAAEETEATVTSAEQSGTPADATASAPADASAEPEMSEEAPTTEVAQQTEQSAASAGAGEQPTVRDSAEKQEPVVDAPGEETLPTQEEIDESAAAAAEQVEAAGAARAQDAPEPTGETITAEPAQQDVQTEDIAPAEGRLGRLRGRLAKSNNVIGQGVLGILSAGDLDEDAWEEIEDTLIMADLGASTTMKVVDSLREKIAARGVHNEEEARAMLRETLIEAGRPELDRSIKAMPYDNKPAVVLVVGVNGTGKTTTVGKLGRVLVSMGHSVMFGAADTFRAAAADQLEAWGRRVGASTVRGKEGADPASVAFDAVAKGTEQGVDVVLVDTAGRLHTSTGLMDQLGKVKRVVEKKAKVDEVLLVLDATVGQNGIIQARTFRDVVDITGVVLTKLDGTAKGGIVFQVQEELGVPVKLVGLGEGADDLAPFEVESFVDALLY